MSYNAHDSSANANEQSGSVSPEIMTSLMNTSSAVWLWRCVFLSFGPVQTSYSGDLSHLVDSIDVDTGLMDAAPPLLPRCVSPLRELAG